MADVKREVLEVVKGAKPWGVDVVDVRITRADYVEAITESVYRRMEAERKRVANELRSTGAAEGEKIRADADRQREVAVANAYRDAQKIKGEGDAQAAATYAEAFGRDPQFAQFYRSLEAYKSSFNKKSDVMVVDPSSTEFFRAFRNGGSGGGGAAPAAPAAGRAGKALGQDVALGRAGPDAGVRRAVPLPLARRLARPSRSCCSCATGSCASSGLSSCWG
jgi:membrane protease subunit HflC